ncbi:hypothetical protein KX928_12560 [Roseobacter sp. YSTF-M11]|uniref:DUF6950 domain-containing protein n=1 Tax=Roseobacter insulae TaxID=2859783 RepID=A0A9X1JYT9_9RHOB|nr:hypothetical protein [Roseobacter insulae]MBW4708616.1 hypothetical protein [Roseobacter insulae]
MADINQRRPDWRNRLIIYLHAAARRPFVAGEHDCALFLAGGVEAMTGVDYAERYRGAYSSTKAGLRLLQIDGFTDHVDLALCCLPSKPVSMAFEGDGAVIREGRVLSLGIVQGASIYVLRASGLGTVPLTAAAEALGV